MVYVVNIAVLMGAGALTSALPAQLAPLAPAAVAAFPVTGINHPTGLAVSPDGSQLLVTGTDSDNVAVIPLVSGAIPAATVPALVSVHAVNRDASTLGSSPDAVAYAADGKHAYVRAGR